MTENEELLARIGRLAGKLLECPLFNSDLI